MKGFVPTPDNIVDIMVEKLFNSVNVTQGDAVLDPGCGTGAFIELTHPTIRGDLLELEFVLPELDTSVKVRAGAVIWCGSLRENGPAGAGIQFLTISAEYQKEIADFVKSMIDTETALDTA